MDPSDGTSRPGARFDLKFQVTQLSGSSCTPLPGWIVDTWHCDHLGVYSDVVDTGFNTVGKKFLRGYQTTDANGAAGFTTIYPGWYSGRAVHIHFKIRSALSTSPNYEFTSQLYFSDNFTDGVYTLSPCNTRGARTTRNSQDGIYASGGSQLLLSVAQGAQGYEATFQIALA